MKKLKRVLPLFLIAATLLSIFALSVGAETQNGWSVDEDGVERYYVNGDYVTGVYTIDGFPYKFGEDGGLLGLYDGHFNVGEQNTANTTAYRDALKALVTDGGKIYHYTTFEEGESFLDKNFSTKLAFGEIYGDVSSQTSKSIYTKVGDWYSSSSKSNIIVVERYNVFNTVAREDGGSALLLRGCVGAIAHSYVDLITDPAPKGEELVVEGEFKLGSDFGASHAVQLIDRGNVDTVANCFYSILNINANGGVYISSDTSKFVCVLSENEYTRISVAIHPSTNTLDVYINGLKVVSGAEFISDTDTYNPMNFEVEGMRCAQFTGNTDLGSMYLDNFAIYGASEPVCTVTSSGAKNGVYLEGGVLRYYANNFIYYGNKTLNGEYLGIKFDNKIVSFGSASSDGSYSLGNTATVIIDGAVNDSSTVAGNVFTVPDAVLTSAGEFGGWLITDGANKVLLSPGEAYHMSGDITCEAVAMDVEMLYGASVRTSSDGAALRFMAKVSATQYELLKANGATIETHMLIVPTEYFDNTHGYHTVEALNKSGYTELLDITVTEWYTTANNYHYFVGCVEDIAVEDYTNEYSALAYLKITYPNGNEFTVYSDYDEELNSRSVYYVASAAYNDRTTLKDQASYSNVLKYNKLTTYTPYDEARLAILKGYANTVIAIDVGNGGITFSGDFYDSPYELSSEYNIQTLVTDVTLTSSENMNICGIYVNGELLSADKYTVSGSTCKLSVDIGEEQLSELKLESEALKSWKFVDVYNDETLFPYLNYEAEYIYGDDEYSGIWEYTKGSISMSPTAGAVCGNHTAYYSDTDKKYYFDFSAVKAIKFNVYCDTAKASQTFYFILNSENPNSDGSDYYGKLITLKPGWNEVFIDVENIGTTRSPLGKDKVTSLNITSIGWDQNNDVSTILYFTDMIAYNKSSAASPFAAEELENAAVFAVGGYYSVVNGEKYANSLTDTDSTAFKEDGVYYLPMASIAAAKGTDAKYYSSSKTLVFNYGSNSYVFNVSTTKYTVNGKNNKLSYAPKLSGDTLCFAVEDVMELFGYTECYIDRMGLIVLSDTADIYDEDDDYDDIFSMIEELVYVRPDGDAIVSDLNSHSSGVHPYLMINEEGFNDLRYYAEMDATMQAYIAKLEKSYGVNSNNFKASVNYYHLTDGQRLLSVSRDVMTKTIAWALLAKLYEYSDPELCATYAERCWDELEAACNFNDGTYYSWHPSHFLDTGELAYPMAICYDWLYDYWTKTNDQVGIAVDSDGNKLYKYAEGTTRLSLMEDSMYWMALAATNVLESDTTGKYINYSYSISGSTNNWNGVCNGGLMAAALAICNVERYSSNVATYLTSAIKAIEKGMWVYAPEGGYEEGPGYWSYGTTYVQVFISCLDSACGTNYGVYNMPGFANSVYFTTYLGTKNTTWGFHDGGSGSADTSIAAWFARKANDPNVNAIRRQAIENGWKSVSMYDIMYFSPHIMTSNITLTLDAYYSLDTIMTFRSSWDADTCLFAGLHGGDNQASHGDIDIGNFVINANGYFMICDLGSDSYNMPGYFGNYRWSYYRKRAEGQNTLVMLPSSENVNDNGWNGKSGTPALVSGSEASNTAASTNLPTTEQLKNAVSECIRYESGTDSALGIVDMSCAYEYMTEGIRGMYMTDNRSVVVLQDEAVFSEDMDIWWFAHTQGEITLIDGGKAAVIYYKGVYLYAEIVTDMDASAVFNVMAAESLDKNYTGWTESSGYYTGDTESSRSSYSKLCVRVDDTDELRLAVVFKVIDSREDVPELGATYTWTDMAEWKVN